jgi:hypothetical protein
MHLRPADDLRRPRQARIGSRSRCHNLRPGWQVAETDEGDLGDEDDYDAPPDLTTDKRNEG